MGDDKENVVGSKPVESGLWSVSSTPKREAEGFEPWFGQKPVESMTAEEARGLFREMVLEGKGKYRRWPSDVYNKRLDELFRKSGLFEEGKAKQEAEKAETRRLAMQMSEGAEDLIAKRQYEQGMKVLRQQWGADCDRNINTCQRFLKDHSSLELRRFLVDSGLGNDPGVVNFVYSLAKLGEQFPELVKTLAPMLEQGVLKMAKSKGGQ